MEYFCSSCKFEIPVRSCSSQQNSFRTSIKSSSHDQLTTPLQQPASVQLPMRSAVKSGAGVKAGGGGNGRLWKRCGLPGAALADCRSKTSDTETSTAGWRRGVVVSGVRQWTKLTHVGPGYNWNGWPSSSGYTISGCNQPTKSTQPCIPPGSLNRVPASAGVKAGMSPLPGGR